MASNTGLHALSGEQRTILERAMAKKAVNDAASKSHGKSAKGKYLRKATNKLAARQKAYASMGSAIQATMRPPGSMKLVS